MRYLRHEADCLAWPWRAVEEFARGGCSFDRQWTLPRLRERMKEHGCPEITQELIDKHWNHGDRLTTVVRRVARERLFRDGDAWRLVPDEEMPGREILRWRFLNLVLPPGLLVAAAGDGRPPPLHVDVLHRGFAPVGPVAHLHLHVGAACSFELLWTHLMSRRDRLRLKDDPKLWPGWTAESWVAALTYAALARRVLAALVRDPMATMAKVVTWIGGEDWRLVEAAIEQLIEGTVVPFTGIQRALVFRAATRNRQRWRTPRTMCDVWRNDPIDDGCDWPEGAMMAAVFARLPDGRPDRLEALFVQYLRIKCLLHRILVHDPTDQGLDGFVHTYHQIAPYRQGLDRVLPDFALAERGIELQALEVRTAPPNVSEVRRMVDDLHAAVQGRDIEVGWVFHFIRDVRCPQPRFKDRDVGEHASRGTIGWCYQRLFGNLRAAGRRLRMALELRPWLLSTFRGLDIAGSERRGPLWIAAPIFAQMRSYTQELAVQAGVMPLQVTLHVGEDFRHLASGLRAIHEPFQWGLIGRGDRLGHALALGMDPEAWCARHPQVLLPRWERILDLAWMIGAAEGQGVGLHNVAGDGFGLILARMRRTLGGLLREVPGAERVAPDAAVRLHGELFKAVDPATRRLRETVPLLMTQRRDYPSADDPCLLAWLRLFGERATQDTLDAPVAVDTAGELPLLTMLSRELTRLVGLWQVAIEVNPSSNLLIAGFDAPLEQPSFRLHPLDPGPGIALPVTINADDPLTFSTSLADEFAYAWAAIVLVGGVAPGRAHAWLHEAGNASWRARFTLPPKRHPCEDHAARSLQQRCAREAGQRRSEVRRPVRS